MGTAIRPEIPSCLCPSLFAFYSNCNPAMSVCLSFCLSVRLSARLSVCPSACPSACPSICPSVCLSVRPSVRLSVCLSICPFACTSVCLFVCLSVFLTDCSHISPSGRLFRYLPISAQFVHLPVWLWQRRMWCFKTIHFSTNILPIWHIRQLWSNHSIRNFCKNHQIKKKKLL